MRTERGFTLLEVMISFIIASLALAVLLPGALDGLKAARTAGRYEDAVSRAQSHLAALDDRVIRLRPGVQQGDDGNGFHWRTRITPIASEIAVENDSSAPSGTTPVRATLYAVSVTIWWGEGIGRQITLTTKRVALEGLQS